MTATQTMSATRSRTQARCHTVVANELYNASIEIVQAYGLTLGILTSRLDVLMHGLRVWIATKQLDAVVLELLDRKGALVRKFRLPVDFGESDQDGEEYQSELDEFRAFLAGDRVKVHTFRFLVCMNTDDQVAVKGWRRGELTPDRHLQSRKLTDKLVCTKFARAGVYVYTDDPQFTRG